MNLGYACINMTLAEQKISTNRSMIKKTFNEQGVLYASELAYQNVVDFATIIEWNVKNNILLYRMSSDIFPWASEYKLSELPHFNAIAIILKRMGDYAKAHKLRIGCHPGPFNVLCSPNDKVVENTIKDLTLHGEIFDLMGLYNSPYNKINIHCNGAYGDKVASMDRFCDNFQRLPHSVQSRLTIENDDFQSKYSVKDLMRIHEKTGIPIVFDYHHHQFNTGGLSEEEVLKLAVSTWRDSITPVVHYSESKSLHENNTKIKPQAHSDFLDYLPNTYGIDVDIMLECKMKELALLRLRDKYQI